MDQLPLLRGGNGAEIFSSARGSPDGNTNLASFRTFASSSSSFSPSLSLLSSPPLFWASASSSTSFSPSPLSSHSLELSPSAGSCLNCLSSGVGGFGERIQTSSPTIKNQRKRVQYFYTLNIDHGIEAHKIVGFFCASISDSNPGWAELLQRPRDRFQPWANFYIDYGIEAHKIVGFFCASIPDPPFEPRLGRTFKATKMRRAKKAIKNGPQFRRVFRGPIFKYEIEARLSFVGKMPSFPSYPTHP